MKDHEFYQELISRTVDGEPLSSEERRELETHLAECAECRAFADFCGALDQIDWTESAPPELSRTVMAKIKPRRKLSFYLTRGAAGLAACLVLLLGVRALTDHLGGSAGGSTSSNGAPMMAASYSASDMDEAIPEAAPAEMEILDDGGPLLSSTLTMETAEEDTAANENTAVYDTSAKLGQEELETPMSAAGQASSDSALASGAERSVGGAVLHGLLHVAEDGSVSFTPEEETSEEVVYRLMPETELEPGDYTGTFTVADHTEEEGRIVFWLLPQELLPWSE